MAFSGGVFSRLYDWTTDRDNGVKILASRMDQEFDGIATGLSTCILKDGTQTCTAAVPFAEGLTIPDDKTLVFGTDSDVTIQYDETTNNALEIAANVEGAALGVVLKADQGDDNADQWKVNVADGGTLSINSKISGSFVSQLTLTPNATAASSTTAIAGNITVGGTVDGRDLATDGSKLDGIEASADVTDTANVTAAGALMDSEVTNLAQVKSFDSADYATAAQGSTADSALQNVSEDTTPQLGGNLDTNSNNINFADNDKAQFGAGNDLQIYHDGSSSYVKDNGSGNLVIDTNGAGTYLMHGSEIMASFVADGAVGLRHDNSEKLATTASGIDVTGTAVTDGLESASSSTGEFNALVIHQATNTSGDEARIQFKRTTDGGSDREVAAIVADRVGGNDTALVFETNTDGSDGATERVRITQDGSVGIGLTTPTMASTGVATHIHTDTASAAAALRLTNATTTSGTSDGVLVAMWNDNNAYFYNYHDSAVNIGTNNKIMLQMSAEGVLGIFNGRNNVGILSGKTGVTLADDASVNIFVSGSNTAGRGVLCIYESSNGGGCVASAGYAGVSILHETSPSGDFVVGDTDGKLCIINSAHGLSFKNRIGATKSFFITWMGAGGT